MSRALLVNDRRNWTTEQVVAASAGQQQMVRVFHALQDEDWLNGRPLYLRTGNRMPLRAFYCTLGISRLHYLHRQAQSVWAQITVEKLKEELEQIQ